MAIGIGGKIYNTVSVLTEPNTYDADITPENMQRGMTAYAKGKKIVGTGKAFEFAYYGLAKVRAIYGLDENTLYGFKKEIHECANIIIISPTGTGDVLFQTTNIIEMQVGVPVKIGLNSSASSEIFAYSDGEYFYIYSTEILDINTQFFYFFGKDNEV